MSLNPSIFGVATSSTPSLSICGTLYPAEFRICEHAHRPEGDTGGARVQGGLKMEELKVEVEDGRVLQISGERKVEKEDKTDTWHRVERSSGKFWRRFRLPKNVNMDQIRATMENVVLIVEIDTPL